MPLGEGNSTSRSASKSNTRRRSRCGSGTPVSVEAIEEVTDRIERAVADRGEKEVPSAVVGEAVVQALRELDSVAYVRFASVYRSLQDIDEFVDELEGLLKERRAAALPSGTRRARATRPRARK